MKTELDNIQNAVKSNKHRFRLHALERMVERDIQPEEIKEAILNGEVIDYYPDDKYGPSCLLFGKCGENKILHVHCFMDMFGSLPLMILSYPLKNGIKTLKKGDI